MANTLPQSAYKHFARNVYLYTAVSCLILYLSSRSLQSGEITPEKILAWTIECSPFWLGYTVFHYYMKYKNRKRQK